MLLLSCSAAALQLSSFLASSAGWQKSPKAIPKKKSSSLKKSLKLKGSICLKTTPWGAKLPDPCEPFFLPIIKIGKIVVDNWCLHFSPQQRPARCLVSVRIYELLSLIGLAWWQFLALSVSACSWAWKLTENGVAPFSFVKRGFQIPNCPRYFIKWRPCKDQNFFVALEHQIVEMNLGAIENSCVVKFNMIIRLTDNQLLIKCKEIRLHFNCV